MLPPFARSGRGVPAGAGFGPLDLRFNARIVTGRDLYDEVIRDGILVAKRAVWIATANLKELYVPGTRGRYHSIMESFESLSDRGVDLRILHAELPSRRFRASFDKKKDLVQGGLKLKHCPRNHMKAVIVDGEKLYLGSANLTGAGLGVKNEDRRNFELGFVTEEPRLLDEVQAMFDQLWRGTPCDTCKVKDLCPDPGGYAKGRISKKPKKALKRLDDDESR